MPGQSTGWNFLIGIVYVAILYTLVRPQSQGPEAIKNVSTGLINLVNAATGGGSWSGIPVTPPASGGTPVQPVTPPATPGGGNGGGPVLI